MITNEQLDEWEQLAKSCTSSSVACEDIAILGAGIIIDLVEEVRRLSDIIVILDDDIHGLVNDKDPTVNMHIFAEREACAKLADNIGLRAYSDKKTVNPVSDCDIGRTIATAIRSRTI